MGKYDSLSFVLATCLVVVILGAIMSAPPPDYQEMYKAAVRDASRDDPARIVHNLTAISDANARLVRDSQGRVLLVTWTSWGGYDALAGKEMNLSVEVWVTVGREAQGFCRKIPAAGWPLRMEQELGLPPGSNKTKFVEMFAEPEDVFRPCADPEIADAECGLEFPANVSPEYRAWFSSLRNKSCGEKGYPWTRLGYTYDWGRPGHVGLSEYVVRPGAEVEIAGVFTSAEYCGKAS